MLSGYKRARQMLSRPPADAPLVITRVRSSSVGFECDDMSFITAVECSQDQKSSTSSMISRLVASGRRRWFGDTITAPCFWERSKTHWGNQLRKSESPVIYDNVRITLGLHPERACMIMDALPSSLHGRRL